MIAVTHTPAAAPGLVVVALVLIAAGVFGYGMWLSDQDRQDHERREQYRRDQKAQQEWDEMVAASRRRTSTGPRVLP